MRRKPLEYDEFPSCEKCIYSEDRTPAKQGLMYSEDYEVTVICRRHPDSERSFLIKKKERWCGEGEWLAYTVGNTPTVFGFSAIFDSLSFEEYIKEGKERKHGISN
jgi:hypothetical protein